MSLDRRTFLASVAGAFSLDPEYLLFVPGKKLISIPLIVKPRDAFKWGPLHKKDHIDMKKFRQSLIREFPSELHVDWPESCRSI